MIMFNGLYVVGVLMSFLIALLIKYEWDNTFGKQE